MQKWEYNLLVQSPNTECARCEEALNGLGRDGWELVTFYVNGAGDNVFVLKKPKEQQGDGCRRRRAIWPDRKERKHGNVLRLDRLLRQLCRQLHAAWLGKLIGSRY